MTHWTVQNYADLVGLLGLFAGIGYSLFMAMKKEDEDGT